MKRSLLADLRLPALLRSARSSRTATSSDDVESGELVCARLRAELAGPRRRAATRAPRPRRAAAPDRRRVRLAVAALRRDAPGVRGAVPRLAPPDRAASSSRASAFSTPGCGTGRHAYFAAQYGAREVVALDLSEAVETARDNLAQFDNVHVVQGDLLRPPFRTAAQGGGFDLVYSIGVLHHLPDPYAGLPRAAPLRAARRDDRRLGLRATRTTASCGTWSSRCGGSRRRCRRRSCAALAWPLGGGVPRRREGRLPAARRTRRRPMRCR